MWRNCNLDHTRIFCSQGASCCHEKLSLFLQISRPLWKSLQRPFTNTNFNRICINKQAQSKYLPVSFNVSQVLKTKNRNKYKARFLSLRIYTTIEIAGPISNRGVTEPIANIFYGADHKQHVQRHYCSVRYQEHKQGDSTVGGKLTSLKLYPHIRHQNVLM